MRAKVLPLLAARWPGVGGVLARTARHQADARMLLDEMAKLDLSAVGSQSGGPLSCSRLRMLSTERQRNVVRFWIKRGGYSPPSAAQLDQILTSGLDAGADRAPVVTWPGAEVRRYRDDLFVMSPIGSGATAGVSPWELTRPRIFAHGELWAKQVRGAGIAASLVPGAGVECRFRAGGERCRPAGRKNSHPLRKLLQEHGVAPWLRARIPLIYMDGVLAAVAGLFVCEGFAAVRDELGWAVHWQDFALVLNPETEEFSRSVDT